VPVPCGALYLRTPGSGGHAEDVGVTLCDHARRNLAQLELLHGALNILCPPTPDALTKRRLSANTPASCSSTPPKGTRPNGPCGNHCDEPQGGPAVSLSQSRAMTRAVEASPLISRCLYPPAMNACRTALPALARVLAGRTGAHQ